MPELERLRRWTLPVAVADNHQRRSLRFVNEVDRGAFVVGGRVIVNRGAEVGDHPLVDRVLAVIALPVGDARSRNRRAKAIRLGHREHGHESAVAPAGDADPGSIDRILCFHSVHPGKNVAQVAIAEILAIGCREGFALPIAAAGIGEQNKVVHRREGAAPKFAEGQRGHYCGGWSSVDIDDKRVFLRGVIVRRLQQPAIHMEGVAGPGNRLRRTP